MWAETVPDMGLVIFQGKGDALVECHGMGNGDEVAGGNGMEMAQRMEASW